MMSAPAAMSASTSFRLGVIRTSPLEKLPFVKPMIGRSTAARTARMFSGSRKRSPIAPPLGGRLRERDDESRRVEGAAFLRLAGDDESSREHETSRIKLRVR